MKKIFAILFLIAGCIPCPAQYPVWSDFYMAKMGSYYSLNVYRTPIRAWLLPDTANRTIDSLIVQHISTKDDTGKKWAAFAPDPDGFSKIFGGLTGLYIMSKDGATTLFSFDTTRQFGCESFKTGASKQGMTIGWTSDVEQYINSWNILPKAVLPISFQIKGVTKAQLDTNGNFDFVKNIYSHEHFYQDNNKAFFQKNTAGDYKGWLCGRNSSDKLCIAYGVGGLGIWDEDWANERITVDVDGNVGIGTTPTVKLDVIGAIKTDTLKLGTAYKKAFGNAVANLRDTILCAGVKADSTICNPAYIYDSGATTFNALMYYVKPDTIFTIRQAATDPDTFSLMVVKKK